MRLDVGKINIEYCQSCGLPLTKETLFGTNADGKKNAEYCTYCYQDGEFVGKDCTMEQMIEICVKPMVKNCPGISENKAKKIMEEQFPTLKRWKSMG